MADTARSEVLTARVTPADLALIDVAARLRGLTRHHYAAAAAVRAAERDLERLTARAVDAVGDDGD